MKVPLRRLISSILLFVPQVSFLNWGEGSGWWHNPVIGEFWLGLELWWRLSLKRGLFYWGKGRFLFLFEFLIIEQEIIDQISEMLPIVLFFSQIPKGCCLPRFTSSQFLRMIWAALDNCRRFWALGTLEMSSKLSRRVTIVYLLNNRKKTCLIDSFWRSRYCLSGIFNGKLLFLLISTIQLEALIAEDSHFEIIQVLWGIPKNLKSPWTAVPFSW